LINRKAFARLLFSCQTSLAHFKVSAAVMVPLLIRAAEFSRMNTESSIRTLIDNRAVEFSIRPFVIQEANQLSRRCFHRRRQFVVRLGCGSLLKLELDQVEGADKLNPVVSHLTTKAALAISRRIKL
jgi:hypothetical protein